MSHAIGPRREKEKGDITNISHISYVPFSPSTPAAHWAAEWVPIGLPRIVIPSGKGRPATL
jgi:hypothetical protein